MNIPYKFNPLGINKKSSFDLNKGLLFHAPLQENFDANGGALNNNPSTYGWIFQTNYFNKSCVYGSSSSQGILYNMENPISGHVPFTMSVEFLTVDFTSGDNRSLFYIGCSTVDKAFGFEFTKEGGIGTAWGDSIEYDNTICWRDYVYQWTIFTATYDMQKIRIYFNGELKATSNSLTLNIQESTGSFSGVYGDLAIGSRWKDNRYWKNGLRNQFVYDYALSDQEVKAFYEVTSKL